MRSVVRAPISARCACSILMIPSDPVVAAGAPWFMTLFGRDSLITSLDDRCTSTRSLAPGCLRALARLQGDEIDDPTPRSSRARSSTSCASATAAPASRCAPAALLRHGRRHAAVRACSLGELARWGAWAPTTSTPLLPARRPRARLDRSEPATPTATGSSSTSAAARAGSPTRAGRTRGTASASPTARSPTTPIALVRGAGLRVRRVPRPRPRSREAWSTTATGAAAGRPGPRRSRAVQRAILARADRAGSPSGSTRQATHRLGRPPTWVTACGPGSPTRSTPTAVVERLMSPEMWTGWGIRTLASDDGRPTTRSATTTVRCGPTTPPSAPPASCATASSTRRTASRTGSFAASEQFDGRLPELLTGIDRDWVGVPVRYPTSCTPQAWSAASPLYLLRILLGIEPDEHESVVIEPHMPGVVTSRPSRRRPRRFQAVQRSLSPVSRRHVEADG